MKPPALRKPSPAGALNFFPLETVCLHHVTRLESFVALEPDAALLSCRHLPHVLFEVLQRADPGFMHQLPSSEQLDPAATGALPFHDAPACDDHQRRDLYGGDDLDPDLADVPVGWLAQSLGGALDILRELVDDVVVPNLDLGPLRRRLRSRRRLEVEAHDDRVGDAREQEVGIADGAHALADDLDRHHRVFDLLQRREHGLERALSVGLHDQAELLDLAFLGAAGAAFTGYARRPPLSPPPPPPPPRLPYPRSP